TFSSQSILGRYAGSSAYVSFLHHTAEKINEVQLPPNPNEFDITCLIFCPLKNSVSGAKGNSSICVLNRRLGKITPGFIANTENTASTPPLAPSVCPVNDFVELM